ncbi:MAG: GGDEF domain-containing protein [Colwellia sp.]|nr:GGDEF domain-containing protein [Colwellia sp.]
MRQLLLNECKRLYRPYGLLLFCTLILLGLPQTVVAETKQSSNYYNAKLVLASKVRASNRTQFNQIVNELSQKKNNLSIKQKTFLIYLQGYQKIIAGELKEGVNLLDQVINQDNFVSLKYKAITTKVSVYNLNENYLEGFEVVNKFLPMLNKMKDRDNYREALFVIAMFYNRLTQYQLSQKLLDKLMASNPSLRQQCMSSMLQVEAAFRLDEMNLKNILVNKAALCEQEGEYLASGIIYIFTANWYIKNGQPQLALNLLKRTFLLAKKTKYYLLISEYNSLIAQSYFELGRWDLASLHANKALNDVKKEHKSESIVRASKIMYKIKKSENNFSEALKYHEIYQKHFQLINDDLNKRNISYQIAQEEVIKKAHQISLLDGKNKVLELEKQLFENSAQKKKFLIFLLITALLALSYWAYLSKKTQLRLKDMAEHDELTGIFNRHSFNELASSALNYCRKTNQDVSLILFDLDNFKRINDTYGHDIGDWVLKKTIETCQQLSRKNDIIGRFGGEEFTILLPGCNDIKAAELADKYRKAIFAISTIETGFEFQVSASFGICPSLAKNKTLQDVLKAADQAMYHAKRNGRNQVSIYGMNTSEITP